MKKLQASKNTYYQNKWENNGFLIIELCVDKFLIWKDGQLVKWTRNLEEAEAWTNKGNLRAEAQRLYQESPIEVQRAYDTMRRNKAKARELADMVGSIVIDKELQLEVLEFTAKQLDEDYRRIREVQTIERQEKYRMSKSILIIDTPKNCNECPLGTKCLTQLNANFCRAEKKRIVNPDCTTKPDWCPLQKIPDKKELSYENYGKDMEAEGFNTCIDEILNGHGGIKRV